MHRRYWYFMLTFLLMMSLALTSLLPAPAQAIGEVTPTPAPAEPTPLPETVDVEQLIDEGLSALQNGNFRQAIALMDQVIAVESDNGEAYLIRGVAHTRLSQQEDAIADFSAAIDLTPYQWDLYVFRGNSYAESNDLTGALTDYDTAIEINPFAAQVFQLRSEVNFQLGDAEAGNMDDFIARGLQSLNLGDLASAEDFLLEAVAINPESPTAARAHYGLAALYGQQEDLDSQFDAYTAAMEADPTFHNAYLARGIWFRENGDVQAAGEDFEQRIRLHGVETIQQSAAIGDVFEIEMGYRLVYEITFEAEAGQVVTLAALSAEVEVDPLLALLGPDGTPIAGDDDFGNGFSSQLDNFTLPASGTYTMLISHAEGGYDVGFVGPVEIRIEEE